MGLLLLTLLLNCYNNICILTLKVLNSEGPVTKSTLLTFMLVPLGPFEVCTDAKERVGCGKQREPTTPIQSLVKLQPWVTEFAVEDLPLNRTAAMVPEIAVKDLPLGRTL